MRHQPLVAAVLQAEHHAVHTYGHGAQHDGNVCHESVQPEQPERRQDDQRHEQQADSGHRVDEAVSQHVAHGNAAQGGADDEQGRRDSHVTHQMEPAGHGSRCLPLEEGYHHGREGGHHAGREQQARAESLAQAARSSDENDAYRENKHVEGDGEHRGIEHGTRAEDGAYHRKADKRDIAEGEHEAHQAAPFRAHRPQAREEVGAADEQDVVEYGDQHQLHDLFRLEDETFAHDGSQDQAGSRHVEHEDGHLAVQGGIPQAAARGGESGQHDPEEHQHLRYDMKIIHDGKMYVSGCKFRD